MCGSYASPRSNDGLHGARERRSGGTCPLRPGQSQRSTCSAMERASSTSMPRYLTVLSILVWPFGLFLANIFAPTGGRVALALIGVAGAMIIDIALLLNLADHGAAAGMAGDQAREGEAACGPRMTRDRTSSPGSPATARYPSRLTCNGKPRRPPCRSLRA
jgi:hypothetical protein